MKPSDFIFCFIAVPMLVFSLSFMGCIVHGMIRHLNDTRAVTVPSIWLGVVVFSFIGLVGGVGLGLMFLKGVAQR